MLTAWADAGAFSLAAVPDEVPLVRAHPPQEQADALTGRDFTRTIDRNWRRTSYSALAAAGEANPVGDVNSSGDTEPETDTVGNSDEQEVVVADLAGTGVRSPMAGLPVGATFGSLVHAVLETADLQAEDLRAELLERISDERVRWPVDLDADELAAALELVCATPLGTIADDVTLRDLAPSDRLAEMDFELPLGGGDLPGTGSLLRQLGALMRRHLPAEDPLLPYAAKLETPDFGNQVLRGYLTGSVDLLFRRGGRYFVVDHKTNWLGAPESEPTVDDYAPDRLAAAMTHTSYPLQALLYAVVLHRYLRWRLPGYDPETAPRRRALPVPARNGRAGHPTSRRVPARGLRGRPPAALIEELSALLDGSHATANASGDDR